MNRFSDRKFVIAAIFIFIGVVFLLRLFYIQVLDDDYKLSANNNVLRYVTQYPARGLIYDRDGELLVYNEAAYDLMVIPRQVKDLDTQNFCTTLGNTKEVFIKKMKAARNYSPYKESIFEKQLSAETYATLQEKLYSFHGFYVQSRTLRKYPGLIAAHTLGYVGEVSEKYTRSGTKRTASPSALIAASAALGSQRARSTKSAALARRGSGRCSIVSAQRGRCPERR